MSLFSLDEKLVVEAVAAVSPAGEGPVVVSPVVVNPASAGSGVAGRGVAGRGAAGRGMVGGAVARGADAEGLAGPWGERAAAAEDAGPAGELAGPAERFARATWSGIAEPGDSLAVVLVSALGASAALTALVEQQIPRQILEALDEAGADGISPHALASALERWKPRLVSSSALTSLRQAARCGARLVIPGDGEWPEALDDLGPHQPLALWVRGRPGAARGLGNAIAVVGARASTGYGDHMAMEISAGLADRGVGVVSGAAYGIDGMAHRSALASLGQTFAFLAGGVDRFYPSGHDALLSRIAEVGVVLSELPCGSAPTKWRFLQRNRLIAAAARATVVVEAGIRSGSLNTAAHAASLGRPLGAVPGPVTSLSSAGCHRLLREFDAVCVTTADEVIELAAPALAPGRQPMLALAGMEVPGSAESQPSQPPQPAPPPQSSHPSRTSESLGPRSPVQVRVLDAVGRRTHRTTEDVARRAGLGVAETQAALGSLGLDGLVQERDGGWRTAPPG